MTNYAITNEGRRLRRSTLLFPDWSGISPNLRRKVDRLSEQSNEVGQIIQRLRTKDPLAFVDASVWSQYVGELLHPLSEKRMHRIGPDGSNNPQVHLDEYLLFKKCMEQTSCLAQDASFENFLASISTIGGLVTKKNSAGFRSSEVGLDADNHGVRVDFCPADLVVPHLEEVWKQLRHPHIPPAVKAIVGMAGILNCHPFIDGNGRCSRVYFNMLLNGNSNTPPGYVPLKIIFSASRGGFEIRLRDVEENGNWHSIVDYFYSIFLMYENILRHHFDIQEDMKVD
jgi:hypothetical protein